MLGIVIGVGAVVGMVSLGQGATASVQREIASLGTNVLIIIPGATTTGGVRGGLGSVSTLTVDDARDIEKRIGDISLVTYASRSVLQVVHEHKHWNTIALGTTTAFPAALEDRLHQPYRAKLVPGLEDVLKLRAPGLLGCTRMYQRLKRGTSSLLHARPGIDDEHHACQPLQDGRQRDQPAPGRRRP